jgi:branched-chain amino acid transport system ATP-binding protein
MGKPKVLMLDEPSLGLAPVVVNEVFRNIQRIKEAGITVILVEQNAKKSLSIADFAYVIENGRVVMSGTGKEMLENPEVAAAYLGSTRT